MTTDLTDRVKALTIRDSPTVEIRATVIQATWRGYKVRRSRLPLILLYAQKHLQSFPIAIDTTCDDGRVNSSLDEITVLDRLAQKFASRMQVPRSRNWYDLRMHDYVYGWIPVNIKTTRMKSSDNAGNVAMCLYAYTDAEMDLNEDYSNGRMVDALHQCLKSKRYNLSHGRDYYFLVVNKNNPSDIVVNSVRGLSELTSNVNNLPFQVKWANNRLYKFKPICICIDQFIRCIKKTKPSWREQFVTNIKSLS